jgi:hypothetical protein
MRIVRVFYSLILVAVFAAVIATRVWGAPAPITEADYWRLVDQTRAQVHALDGKPAEEVRAGLDGLAETWSQVAEVQMQDGATVPIDSSYLVALLKSEQPNPQIIEGLLSALLRAHDAHVSATNSKPNGTLNSILARPEFQWKPNPLNDLLQKLWDKFAAWLDKISNPIHVPGANVFFTTLAVILLLGVLVYVFRGLFTDLANETTATPTGDDDRDLTSETAFQKAQTLSGHGDYRAAVRYLYLSSLLMMEERGILRYDRSRTNREYLRSVSAHPNLAKPLKSVVDIFDRVWYGFEKLDESTFKEYMEEVEDLKEQKQ